MSQQSVFSPLVLSQSLIVITTSWFAIALDEIRIRRILREKADCKQSIRVTAGVSEGSSYRGRVRNSICHV